MRAKFALKDANPTCASAHEVGCSLLVSIPGTLDTVNVFDRRLVVRMMSSDARRSEVRCKSRLARRSAGGAFATALMSASPREETFF